MKIRRGGVTRHVSERAFDTKFKQQGYEIVEEVEEKEELADKTVDELREIAKEEGLTGYYKLNKDELTAEIEKVK
jgi:hypothetical protein